MTDVRRPIVPPSPPGPRPRPSADPVTTPLPRMAPPATRVPGPRAPLPARSGGHPGAPPAWPPHGSPAPPPQQPPRGPGRPTLLVAVALVAVAVVVLGGVLLARPGVLLPGAEPCAAAPGSTLPGFDDVVGPTDPRGPAGTGAGASAGASPLVAAMESCHYGTGGATLFAPPAPGGRIVMLARIDRVAAEADPVMGPILRGETRAPDPFADNPRSRWTALPRSGITARVLSGAGSTWPVVALSCGTDDAVWAVTALGPVGGEPDTARAVDALALAMACEPLPGLL
jgi:hypothetical protein